MKKEVSISAIKEGTVIDHIPSNVTLKVAEILNLDDVAGIISIATNLPSKKMAKKGIVKIGDKLLTQDEVNKIAVIAPDATVNIIENYNVKRKLKVLLPDIIEKIVKCSNPNCITNNEKAETRFYVLNKTPLKLKCHYCERAMNKEDIVLL
ncbi:aspartate carbamoyltransferase regulatory subunit [Candidatus Woesearchaeota archaeon]|nr:aspartate carbamoyltransferase regulatory subunit [Candidatus Woesearchaeota archaeon]